MQKAQLSTVAIQKWTYVYHISFKNMNAARITIVFEKYK